MHTELIPQLIVFLYQLRSLPSAAGDEQKRLVRLFEIEAQMLEAITTGERQFFANPYARRLFVYDRYSVPTTTRHQLAMVAARSRSALQREELSAYPELCEQYHRLLQSLCTVLLEALDAPTSARQHSTESPSVFTEPSLVQRADMASLSPSTPNLSERVGTAQPNDTQILQTSDQEIFLTKPLRVFVRRVEQSRAGDGHAACVIHAEDQMHTSLRIRVRDEQAVLASSLWNGACLHLFGLQRKAHDAWDSTSSTLMVVEPDVLLDVTDIAECVQTRGIEPLLHFLRPFVPRRSTTALVLGQVINSCFDAIVQGNDADDHTLIRQALEPASLAVTAILDAQALQEIYQSAPSHLRVLRQCASEWKHALISTEPSFMSPQFGLQGRLDLLLEDETDVLRKTVIELKAGSVPALQNGGRSSSASFQALWPNHLAQITCYNLLLDSAFPGRKGDSQILYSRAEEEALRNAPNDTKLKRMVLDCRNNIVVLEHDLLQRRFGVLNKLLSEQLSVPSYLNSALSDFRAMLRDLSTVEQRYLQAMWSFLLREQYTQRLGKSEVDRGMSSLWTEQESVKRSRQNVLGPFTLDDDASDFDAMHLCLRTSDGVPIIGSFRSGDVVLLRPHLPAHRDASSGGPEPLLGFVWKATLRSVDEHTLVLSLRNKTTSRELLHRYEAWMLEADNNDHSLATLMGSFVSFFREPQERRKRLLGLVAPRFSKVVAVHDEGLSELQREIVARALSAEDYFLLQGPPGTGKTSVMVRTMARHLMRDTDQVILLLAYTNRAVDEMVKAVIDLVPPEQLIRMGLAANTEYPQRSMTEIFRGMDFAERRAALQRARIILSTVSFVHSNPELMDLYHFGTAIVDEASQIGEAQISGIVAAVERTIFIGDEKQLPGIVAQDPASCRLQHPELERISLRDLGSSMFSRLLERCQTEGWTDAVAMLEQQGRMHEVIQNMSSGPYYGSRLQVLHAWQRESTMPRIERRNSPEFFEQLLNSRLVFIESEPERLSKRHLAEATVAAYLAEQFMRDSSDTNSNTVGVISPFRAQNREVTTRVPASLRGIVSVDTVERFQGSERENIIYTTALSHPHELAWIESLSSLNGVEVDRKLNVVMTRARQRFVLIGNRTILSRSQHYRQLIEYISAHGIVLSCRDLNAQSLPSS